MIDALLAGLLAANLTGAAAIALVLLLRRPARRLFGARVAYILWAAVPLAAAASLLPEPQAATLLSPIVLTASGAVARSLPAALAADLTALALAAAWLFGALVFAGLLFHRQRRFVAALGRLEPLGDGSPVLRAEHAGVGPAVVGALRPRIVAPADFEARFAPRERQMILAHEAVHLAHGDAWINAVAAACQCLGWFNPLAHAAVRRLRIDQELACDAAVLARFPTARRLYGEVLLKTQISSQALPIGCQWPAAAEHSLKERIVMLKSPLPTPQVAAVGLAAVAALSLGGACAAWAAKPAEPATVDSPDWVRRPTGEDVARVYPTSAAAAGVGGGVVIGCKVGGRGELEACAVISEVPVEYGFGAAGLQLAQYFQMRPLGLDGARTPGGQVRIPIRFLPPGAQPPTK